MRLRPRLAEPPRRGTSTAASRPRCRSGRSQPHRVSFLQVTALLPPLTRLPPSPSDQVRLLLWLDCESASESPSPVCRAAAMVGPLQVCEPPGLEEPLLLPRGFRCCCRITHDSTTLASTPWLRPSSCQAPRWLRLLYAAVCDLQFTLLRRSATYPPRPSEVSRRGDP